MRALILVAGAALAVAACSSNDNANNTMNVDENLTTENIVSNDVTAIDAVTGDAANMAADVDMNFGNLDNGVAAEAANGMVPASKPRPKSPREGTLSAAPEPSTTTANSQ